jgi:hypothetical protein
MALRSVSASDPTPAQTRIDAPGHLARRQLRPPGHRCRSDPRETARQRRADALRSRRGSPFDRTTQHPPEMTAKPGSRQAPRQSHSLAPRRALRIAQAARARRLARNARRPHRPDARHGVRCWIDVSAAPFQSRRHIAGRGRRTRLEHEHHERPQLPHELRKAHTQKAEQRAHCASRLHARRLPARSLAPDGSYALLHGVDCLSERPNSREGSADTATPRRCRKRLV